MTALTVLPLDDVLLSTEAFLVSEDRAVVVGRMVLELSSETFPVDALGGESFRGDEGPFLGGKGGNGGSGADTTCGDRRVNPPSKSLSQSSSSVVDDVP